MYISPSVTLRNVEKNTLSFDASCFVKLSGFQAGIGYRNEKTIFLVAKVHFKEFEFSYSSENPMEASHMIGNGNIFSIGWSLHNVRNYK